MALTTKHTKVATLPDDPSYEVGTTEWNDNHSMLVSGPSILGKTTAGAGAVIEIPLPGGTTDYLRADGTFAIPPDTGATDFTSLTDCPPAYSSYAGKFTRVNATEVGLEFAAVHSDNVEFPVIGSTDKLSHILSDALSAGWISGGTITDAGGATINIALGEGFIRATNSTTGSLKYIAWSALNGTSIPTGANRYIVVYYNAGSPVVQVNAAAPANHQEYIYLGRVFNVGGALFIHNDYRSGGDFAGRVTNWATDLIGTRVVSGEIATDPSSPSRKLKVTAGNIWDRHFRNFTTPAMDSSGVGTFVTVYRDGLGDWTQTSGVTDWPNTQYDNGSGTLQTMTANYYANLWVIRGFLGYVIVMYPQAEYATLAAAQAESAPAARPERLNNHGFYIAQLTFQKSATSPSGIVDIRPLIGGGATGGATSDHNNLGGLQGGTAGQYYHGTSDQNAALAGTSGTPSSTNKFVTDADVRNTNARTPVAHDNTYHSVAYITQDGNARTAVSKNSGATVGTRRKINLIEGTNITLTVADDVGNEEVDVTITAAGGGAHTIKENGTPLTARAGLNFVNGLVATDDLAGDETDVNLEYGGAGYPVDVDSTEADGTATSIARSDHKHRLGIGTTKGDILAHNGTNMIRRAVGTNGQVLTADSAEADGVKWATPGAGSGPVTVKSLTADVTIGTIALAKVTALDQAVDVGTYTFKYTVRHQSAATTTGIRLAVNFSGTVAYFIDRWTFTDVSATASTAAQDQDAVLTTGSVLGNFASRAKSTTTRGSTLSVDTADADMMSVIEGLMEVTVAGNLELWHGSEVAANSTVKLGTSLVLTKTG